MPTNTANMNLILPTIGTDSGLTWEESMNANSNTVDNHNHSAGQGNQINPAGLNINSNLSFNNQQATSLQAAVFQAQNSLVTQKALYVSGVDLYYNDGSGNVVQMTTGGAVNATSSGISSGTATAAFVASVLTVKANSTTPANISGGSILIGNNVSNTKFLTLAPPNAMAADYGLTLPAIPGSQSFMTIDTSGNMSAYASISGGIGTSNLANASVTKAKQAAVGQQISTGCGIFSTTSYSYTDVTNLTVTITTVGRPVVLTLINNVDATLANIRLSTSSTTQEPGAQIQAVRDSTGIGIYDVAGPTLTAGTNALQWPPSSFFWFDAPAAGTYTYKIQAKALFPSTATIGFLNCKLLAYEL